MLFYSCCFCLSTMKWKRFYVTRLTLRPNIEHIKLNIILMSRVTDFYRYENTITTLDSPPATPAPLDIEMAQQIAPHTRYIWKRVLFGAAFIICIYLIIASIPVVFKVDRSHTNHQMMTAAVGLFVTYILFCAPI